MSYGKRLLFLAFLDSAIAIASIYSSLALMNLDYNLNTNSSLFVSLIVLLCSYHIMAYVQRIYHRAWEYASTGELMAIMKSVTISVLSAVIVQIILYQNFEIRVFGITWMMQILLIGGTRFFWRVLRDNYVKPAVKKKHVLIVGAGAAGTMLARQIINNRETDLKPIGFVDDDSKKYELVYYGVPVLGNVREIKKIVQKYKVELVLIAIPSLNRRELNTIVGKCTEAQVKTQIMPKLEDIMTGKVSVNSFRDIEAEDLLGRDPVKLDIASISAILGDKSILVTGAGGSIGSEICRQVSKFNPSKLILLGHGENSIYQIDMELRKQYKNKFEIVPIIADIQDRKRIFEVMAEHRPHVVYHAAAHKHVPLMEFNPKEAIKNNIFGTKNVAEAAGTFGIEKFVLISTDKAVNPTNVMGATKRCAELITQELNQQYGTKYAAVRFGNVLGSRGSVIPLFKKQIQDGGPVTVTHPEMTRYFMTIPEASCLVIQAGALAQGGEIFVLDMGQPVKIRDLAENLIKLSGYTLDEIEITYSGVRPGEKLFEELLNEFEVNPEQIFPKIFIGKARKEGMNDLDWLLENFEQLDSNEIKEKLLEIANPSKLARPIYQAAAN